MKIEYESTSYFQKDFKKLLKRYRSLKSDLEVAKTNAIELYHIHKVDNNSIVSINNESTDQIRFYKIRKFACKALKGKGARSGIRIIYAYHLETSKVCFIEIYYKGDKANEDKDRMVSYLRDVVS